MRVKSMKSFRHWFKMSKPGTRSESWNSDFMGYMKNDVMGFFAMYHGEKPDIYGFLRKETEMAEDGQAIYEFVQNAADSDSSHFYMFYNDKYLLVINNGKAFSLEGVKSILNVGQSHGKDNDPDKIGRFGIGFKLVHRLVGKSNGLKELTEDYCGPQMFSWSKKVDFTDFINTNSFDEEDVQSSNPWLMKILLTNFPASVDEKIKDVDFNDRVPYPSNELKEFQSFLKENISSIESDVMNQGTMFFIKLGEGKLDLLKKDQNDINNRLENTLYFLKNLTHLQVNEKIITRHKGFVVEDKFIIEPYEPDFIKIGLDEKRDKSFPVVLQMGYAPYGLKGENVKEYPNFYKYFPIEDTTYGLQFIFHSNVISIGSNRRHIHEDNTNRELLFLLAQRIQTRIDEHIKKGSSHSIDILANIILSDCNNSFVEEHLINHLINYLSEHVPTDKGLFEHKERVMIKNTTIRCEPSDFGFDKIWFKWDAQDSDHDELIRQSKNKIGLSAYSLKKLLQEGEISCINSWIKSMNDSDLNIFLHELNDNISSNLFDIAFIKLEDGRFVSIRDLDTQTIIKFPKIFDITNVLKSLGFTLSKSDYEDFEELKIKISDYHTYLKPDNESKLIDAYLSKVLSDNTLSPIEKKVLFMTLGTFKFVAEKTLANELKLFCNNEGIITPLSKMVNPRIKGIEPWLKKFSIREDEVFDEITTIDFLRGERTVFNDIIVPNWNIITNSLTANDIRDFLQSVKKYHLLTESPVSLKSKPFVYNSEIGWVEFSKSVFYHNQLINFNLYKDLIEVIQKNDLYAPDHNLLEFYSQEPFMLNDSQLDVLLCSSEFYKDSAIALIEFCKGKLNVFENGYFKDNDRSVYFSNESSKKQYYTSKEDVRSYIKSYCDDKLVSLPVSLIAYKENVLREQDLYRAIIECSSDSWQEGNTALTNLLKILAGSGHTKIVKDFINLQSTISLSVDVNEQTFEWITLLNNFYEVHEIDQIKNKIHIDGIKLSELNWNNKVELDNDETIELGNILSKFNDNQVVACIKDILQKKKCFDSNKINALFQSGVEPTIDELFQIASEMLILEDNKLKNCDQLRLILYLNKSKKIDNLEPIQIQSIDNEWYSLKDDWYLKKRPFVNDYAVLHSNYENIGRKSGTEFSILSKPYFQRDRNQFICPHLKKEIQGEDLIDFLELVKDQILKNAQQKVNWLDNLGEIIGFIPANTILADENIIHKSEKLPTEIADWASKQIENTKILEVTGVHGLTSPIVLLRKHLSGENPDYQFEGFSRNSETDRFLLKNTLDWMEAEKIIFDDVFASVIQSITEYLGAQEDISDVVLPIGIAIKDGKLLCQLKKSISSYYYNEDTIREYLAFNSGSFSNFVQLLIDEGLDIIECEFLSEQWLRNYSTLISFGVPEIDIEALKTMSVSCNLPQYLKWKENTTSNITIQIIDNSIPYTISVIPLEGYAINYSDGEYFFDEQNRILYTTEQKFIDAVLNELKDLLDNGDLAILLGGITPSIHLSREEELLNEIRFLQEQLNRFKSDEDLSRGELPGDIQKDWNLEARNLLRAHLESIPEFNCTDWDDSNVPSTIVNGVLYQGEMCVWIVRSAMSKEAKFHLTPYEWTLLGNKNVFLALRTSRNNIQIYGLNEDIRQIIFEDNPTINFNFDSVKLTFEGMDALANTLVHYNIWGSGLVFKNLNYSAGVTLHDLEKCKDGIVKKLTDESL